MTAADAPHGVLADPEDDHRLWWAVDGFRVCALIYAVALYVRVAGEYRHPVGAWVVLAGLGVWTAFLLRHRDREPVVLVVDLTVAVAAVLSTALLDDPARIAAGAQTLPSIWPAAAVLSWAIWGGWRTGLAAAVAIAVADVVEVGGRLSAATVNNIVILLLLGIVIGHTVTVYRTGRRELASAVAIQAAAAERERLAADIHDSVLQVLAFVSRRGRELGGEAGEIGRLAGEQEVRLRSLINTGQVPGAGAQGEQDVRGALAALATEVVTVTGPAEAVVLPAEAGAAVLGATRAALDNVIRHAGAQARAWVLVEDEGDTVTVTVRDDGVGIAPGRLEAARAEGRVGVPFSICSRIERVGGRVGVVSAPGQGTEIEMVVPRVGAR